MALSEAREGMLRYGDERIPYAIRFSLKRSGKVRIDVRHDGTVEVEAPDGTSPEEISRAVQKRARWIHEHVDSSRQRFAHVLPREYVSGEAIFYLGRRYSLKVRLSGTRERSVKLRGALLDVAHPRTSRYAIRARVRAWYRIKARDYFATRLKMIAKELPWSQDVPQFRLKEMQTRWGSCGAGGTVTLNPFLVKAPRECVDYVLTHELCHLREHNHSPEFYRLLTRAMPEWERIKTRLDDMAELLLND